MKIYSEITIDLHIKPPKQLKTLIQLPLRFKLILLYMIASLKVKREIEYWLFIFVFLAAYPHNTLSTLFHYIIETAICNLKFSKQNN